MGHLRSLLTVCSSRGLERKEGHEGESSNRIMIKSGYACKQGAKAWYHLSTYVLSLLDSCRLIGASMGENKHRQKALFELTQYETQTQMRVVDDSQREELLVSLLALSSIKGVGVKTLTKWFDTGLIFDVWQLDRNDLDENVVQGTEKALVEVIKAIDDNEKALIELGNAEARKLASKGITFVPYGHKDFPSRLTKIDEFPRWIFISGSLESYQSSAIVAIVGTRDASEEGQRIAYSAARQFVERNVTVLSGMARGIDESAHLGAVDYFGTTVAVLGHGINSKFFSANRFLVPRILETGGAIVSEYFVNTPPSRERYLRRNELQAGLSGAVIPLETPSLTSGTGATIRRAQRLKVPVVGLVPDRTESQSLIKTRNNLRESGIPVFDFRESGDGEYWDFFEKLIPTHDWSFNPKPRQDKFFESIIEKVKNNRSKMNIAEADINRFVEMLYAKIQGAQDDKGADL